MLNESINLLTEGSYLAPYNLLVFGKANVLDLRSDSENTKIPGYFRVFVEFGRQKQADFNFLGEKLDTIAFGRDYTILDPVLEVDFLNTLREPYALDKLVYDFFKQDKNWIGFELNNFKDWVSIIRQDTKAEVTYCYSKEFFDFLSFYGKLISENSNPFARKLETESTLFMIDQALEGNLHFRERLKLLSKRNRLTQDFYRMLIHKVNSSLERRVKITANQGNFTN